MFDFTDVFELVGSRDDSAVDVAPAVDTDSAVDVLSTDDEFPVFLFEVEVKDEVVSVVVPTLDKAEDVDVLTSLCCRVTFSVAVPLTVEVVYKPLVDKVDPLEELLLKPMPKSVERYMVE